MKAWEGAIGAWGRGHEFVGGCQSEGRNLGHKLRQGQGGAIMIQQGGGLCHQSTARKWIGQVLLR